MDGTIDLPLEIRNQPGSSDHFVQFYETDKFLIKSLSSFIGYTIKAGEGAIVVATEEHRAALNLRLQEMGIDVEAAIRAEQYIEADAAELLAKLMIDDWPDAESFTKTVEPLIIKAKDGRGHLRIFGEMVALLWASGQSNAAIRLEELWGELQARHKFTLFCAYPINGFSGQSSSQSLAEVCNIHSSIIPTENYIWLDSPKDCLRTILELQQKSKSLQAEMVDHKKLESILAAIVASSSDAIISKTLTGHIISWNKGAEKIFGYTALEMIGQHISTLIPPDRYDEEAKIISEIKQGHPIGHYETVRQRKDGRLISVSLSVSPIKDSTGTVVGASKIARDISERIEMEAEHLRLLEKEKEANLVKDQVISKLEEAQKELARMAAIVESSHDPIMSLSLDGIIQSWNKSAQKLYGYEVKDICGRHISTLFPSEYISDIPKLLMPINRGETISDFETIHSTKVGTLLQVALTVFPVKDGKGEIISSSIIARDLTERKYIERERAKLLSLGH